MNNIAKTCLSVCLFPVWSGIPDSIASESRDAAIAQYENGNYEAALKSLTPLADGGDAEAQYLLGLMYSQGQGVAQDFYKAGKMYRLAGDQGHASAQINLGSLFENCFGNGNWRHWGWPMHCRIRARARGSDER